MVTAVEGGDILRFATLVGHVVFAIVLHRPTVKTTLSLPNDISSKSRLTASAKELDAQSSNESEDIVKQVEKS